MTLLRAIGAFLGALLAVSCTGTSPATTAATVATTALAALPNGQTASGPARRVPPSRDSLAKLRAAYVAQIMAQIAGRENQPAEQVFKNVQVLKGITAAALVQKMDQEYATALSWNCTNCHRLAPQGNFASDTSNDKKRARFMQQMENEINLVQLPKLYPKDTPQVSCGSCHRGYNEPPAPKYLIPERGKPGGLPMLPRPGSRPASRGVQARP
jgi:hypothetical protein